MLPKIFISSTISDLSYLRDAIRDTISEMAYRPLMSEHGEVGFLPSVSAEESCYLTMRESHLAIIIVGKRYGSIGKDGVSITHNEFRVARQNEIPVIFLINKEVMAYKRVFDANENSIHNVPGMDDPTKTFELINEFSSYSKNNGFILFENVSDARLYLKRQLAHIFGDLLMNKYDPLKVDVKDILSEIKTLRHELLKDNNHDYRPFLKSMRLLLDEKYTQFKDIVLHISTNIEDAIPIILKTQTFSEFLNSMNADLEIKEEENFFSHCKNDEVVYFSSFKSEIVSIEEYDQRIQLYVAIRNDLKVYLTKETKEYFDRKFRNLKEQISQK